ncbi:heme NO-binding domain-containing protein [Conexibacter woesei]|uniref:Heme NO binding domain protein n=1 Tax=Conexibacter woesei (strain DSM 14684 / CCUG 47730 / CIP 108061 / JCM 11494 / NBRC 100937 / ID131577) TaxID=469383 RepID=D3F0L8_CONWI|nr:heme NO-binding domain-containing protein [Conexibacter woesei]ADB53952.1 Heme NO binding domain protein [Conexibacter woesei DSM 14684]
MKGIVFNLLEALVVREHGEDAWDELLDRAGVDGAYTTLGSYPDAELLGLVGAASELLGQPPADLVRWFGRESIPAFADSHASFFDAHDDTRSFLLTLTDMIHPEVRKLYPGADVPDFAYETGSADVLVMLYSSPRRLCALAEGLIEGAAAHFDEAVEIGHPRCMHRGDEHCRLEIALSAR